jgi:hypothetical protein
MIQNFFNLINYLQFPFDQKSFFINSGFLIIISYLPIGFLKLANLFLVQLLFLLFNQNHLVIRKLNE